jgi:hypothetical protein
VDLLRHISCSKQRLSFNIAKISLLPAWQLCNSFN